MCITTMSQYKKLGLPASTLLLLGFVAILNSAFAKQKDISQTVFLDMPNSERLLVDVRTPEEYGDGHIPSAINLPLADLPTQFATLGDKEQQIVVYCRSGFRAGKAIKLLKKEGYSNILHLEGDFIAWQASKQPIAKPD